MLNAWVGRSLSPPPCCWCFWGNALVIAHAPSHEVSSEELFRVQEGLRQWRGKAIAGVPSDVRFEAGTLPPPEFDVHEGYDPNHSPLWYLIASAPLRGWSDSQQAQPPRRWAWLERTPFLMFGTLLGASLWYVARRLLEMRADLSPSLSIVFPHRSFAQARYGRPNRK